MELYTLHIICSMRMDRPYILLEKDKQNFETLCAEPENSSGIETTFAVYEKGDAECLKIKNLKLNASNDKDQTIQFGASGSLRNNCRPQCIDVMSQDELTILTSDGIFVELEESWQGNGVKSLEEAAVFKGREVLKTEDDHMNMSARSYAFLEKGRQKLQSFWKKFTCEETVDMTTEVTGVPENQDTTAPVEFSVGFGHDHNSYRRPLNDGNFCDGLHKEEEELSDQVDKHQNSSKYLGDVSVQYSSSHHPERFQTTNDGKKKQKFHWHTAMLASAQTNKEKDSGTRKFRRKKKHSHPESCCKASSLVEPFTEYVRDKTCDGRIVERNPETLNRFAQGVKVLSAEHISQDMLVTSSTKKYYKLTDNISVPCSKKRNSDRRLSLQDEHTIGLNLGRYEISLPLDGGKHDSKKRSLKKVITEEMQSLKLVKSLKLGKSSSKEKLPDIERSLVGKLSTQTTWEQDERHTFQETHINQTVCSLEENKHRFRGRSKEDSSKAAEQITGAELTQESDVQISEDDSACEMVCIDLPLTNFGFYSGEVMILM